ncbi:hypothetical protein ACI48D_14380 [Massilia sp. LXY-6]|uniref:hypothetical protein n=1 Tax=Massilia sp. LXY-6 TaxID=3379823 RepID=UPI003EE0D2B5
MCRLLLSALLMSAATLAAPVSAQVRSTASASGLRYTLGDLRPADGQAPSVSFSSPAGSLYAGGSVSDANGIVLYQQGQSLVWPQDSDEVAWKDAILGRITLAPGGAVGMQGGSAVVSVAAGSEQMRYSIAQGGWDTGFRLAPYSSLTLSLDIDIDVAARVVPDGSNNLYATSSAELRGFGSFRDGAQDVQFGLDSGSALAYDNAASASPEARETKTLSITFLNPNASWGDGHFYLDFGTTAQLQPLSPVPEPTAGSLLAGGLAVLGLGRIAARRRKKRGAAAPLRSRGTRA